MGLFMGGARIIYEAFVTYSGGNRIWILYAAALIYLCIAGGKEARMLFVYPFLLQAVTVFNPVVAGEIVVHFGFSERYLRIMWMLEFFVVTAYAFVHAISRFRNRAVRGCVIAVMAALIVLLGNPVFIGKDAPAYEAAENPSCISHDIIELSKVLHSEGINRPRVLYDGYLTMKYRTYDANVRSVLNRKHFLRMLNADRETFEETMFLKKKRYKDLMRVFFYMDTTIPYERFLKAGKRRKVDYVVLTTDSALNDYMEKAGLEKIGSTQEYNVWRFPTARSVKKE